MKTYVEDDKMENLNKSHFYITHPKFKTESTKDSKENRAKEPIVMLFGWMGAKDQYLKVYSQIYEEKGYPTVRLTVSPLIVLFKNNEMLKFSDKLLKLLDEPDFKDRPVIIHLFSNGGGFQYDILYKALQEDEAKKTKVKGVIFDSGPAKWTIYNSFSVCSMILSSIVSSRLLLYPLTVACVVCSASITGMRKIQRDVFKKPVHLMDTYNNLKNQENLCPQLFFYSKADSLVPYRELEDFIEARKTKGVDVTCKMYEKTPHVKHYPFDKMGYCKTVFKFLNRVVKK